MEPVRNEAFPPQPAKSNQCGAYALAYWWGRHSDTPKTELEIVKKADEYYAAIQFVEQDFIPGLDYDKVRLQSYRGDQEAVLRYLCYVISFCVGKKGNGYCNPQAMMGQIMPTPGGEFYLGGDPLIWAIY
ncbi:MAG: hypothetical protein NC246_16080, partial [Muribaculaceae bacterium]|nr:hypothetical protein [Muribaculaceae bacterium]